MTDSKGPKCMACVDSHCTPDFKTCSGLTPPSSLALEDGGACMDDADQTKWNGGGSASFADDLESCGRGCLGGADCTAKCMAGKGYSENCSTCFGTLTGCTKSH